MVSENEFLFHALLMGIFITFVYDILRIFRRVCPHNSFWVSIEDIAFWIYCAEEVFLLMYYESNGSLRWFAILGAMTGMFFYKKCISSLFVKYASLVLGWVLLPVRKLAGWLLTPFRWLSGLIRNYFIRIREHAKFCRAKNKAVPKKRLTDVLKKFKMNL